MRSQKDTFKKLTCYITGLLVLSIGSNLFLKTALGVAPSCTIALALSELFPAGSYALFNFFVNFTLLICETIVEKKIGKKQLIQFALIFIYSLFIQLTSLPMQLFSVHQLPVRLVLALLSCAVMAAGASFTISSGFAVLPMEGFVSSLAAKVKKPYGTVRVYVEISFTVISAVFSFAMLNTLSVVGIGTVLAAACTGKITDWFTKNFIKRFWIA